MEIEGQLTDVIYQNELNSYTIANLRLEEEEEEITVVGYLPFIHSGDSLKLIGKFVNHPEYGKQFRFDTFEKRMPQSKEALEQYLASGIIKGIGPSTAKRIVELFGEETIQVFRKEPQKLAKVKGITKEKAEEMAQSFIENWDLWKIVQFLGKLGIASSNAKKVYETLGANAIEEIEENPYCLIELVRGADFKQVDQMAETMGISKEDIRRVKTGIKYSLRRVGYNGNTCVLKSNLVMFVQELLQLEKECIENAIIDLKVKEEIVIEKRQQQEWIYLTSYYDAEANIAEKIIRTTKGP